MRCVLSRPEPLTLGFDTSAAHCAAALLCGDQAIAERREGMAKGQAERLMPLLEAVLAAGGADWRALDVVGVGVGPGNFTGMRIAVAAARGLALSLKVPAVGITAFDALGEGLEGPVIAAVAAPRDRIYAKHSDTPAEAARQMAPEDVPAPWAGSGLACVGAEAPALAAATGGRALCPAMGLAAAIARIAARRVATGGVERPAPLYMRAPDAVPRAATAPP